MTIQFNGKDYTDEEFLSLYMDAKRSENDAKEFRTNLERVLLERYGDMVEDDKLSKQFTVNRFTVKIKRNVTYKLSDTGWDLVWKMPENERPIDIKYSHTKGKNIPAILLEEVENETKPSFEVIYK